MANRKFYLVFKNEGGDKMQSIRDWAEENQKYFPAYRFTNRRGDFPITHQIASVLEKELKCKKLEENGNVYLIMPK